ncbi:2Fe-2S iron-sulfur cluster binding domain-containing protein [Endozoicomonas sp. G2_1]|uniref:2Fe-2S iron-sulfur cluster-binding protein n=1 Tax=Endozoicomonas sp. G2_1 TaxID=2821091 RepID=UPI001AD96577|nr:2Fe-2S iron-sulfur cluster-binding protein [Endozoicomonas sp. G2_1]MBO9491080.1 2Fe-2S iron-sulfur cluster binding domain-containing protein [Endozoicomonas sp. G2_1]
MAWHQLTVAEVTKAADATSLSFDVPEHLLSTFSWLPGQHVRIKLVVDGEELKRNYSISAPVARPLQITVKAVNQGKVSGFINQRISVGDTLMISEPSGKFVLSPDNKLRRSHYFFAAGSGITPIYSMLVSMLEREPDSFGYLLYGNKNGKSTIFTDQLAQLAEQYSDRLVVSHCHSSPGWFSQSPWRSSRINAEAIHQFIQENPPYAQDTQYYLCGPGQFLPNVKQALNDIDVPDSRIHMESFGAGKTVLTTNSIEANLSVNLYGNKSQVSVKPGQKLLQAMLDQGIDAPYSCEGGVCGSCRCQLTKGKVDMVNNLALEAPEVEKGAILACQSLALTDDVAIEYR